MKSLKKILVLAGLLGASIMSMSSANAFWWPWGGPWGGGPWGGYPYYGGNPYYGGHPYYGGYPYHGGYPYYGAYPHYGYPAYTLPPAQQPAAPAKPEENK